MLTIEEYIKKRKHKDSIDEFDADKRVENMGSCINYVVDYYKEYLTPEKVDLEYEKRKKLCEEYKEQLDYLSDDILEWVAGIYMEYGKKLDTRVKNTLKQDPIHLLSCSDKDFEELTEIFYKKYENDIKFITGREDKIDNFIRSVLKQLHKNSYPYKDSYRLGSIIHNWLEETYEKYDIVVNLFAFEYLDDLFDKNFELKYDKEKDETYVAKSYDYKKDNNLFYINELYGDIKDKPFITNRKLELEILMIHIWLDEFAGEENYWNTYISEDPERSEIVNT